jgi:hypothetical protein
MPQNRFYAISVCTLRGTSISLGWQSRSWVELAFAKQVVHILPAGNRYPDEVGRLLVYIVPAKGVEAKMGFYHLYPPKWNLYLPAPDDVLREHEHTLFKP